MDELEGDAKKLAMILWACKRHKGELRMFGGKWVKDGMAEIPSWAETIKTPEAQLMAVERRTHPSDHDGDYTAPVLYLDDAIQTAISNTRPYLHEIKGIYWAEGTSGTWRRESRTWSLPALVNVFGHRYSFRWIYVPCGTRFPSLSGSRHEAEEAPQPTRTAWTSTWRPRRRRGHS